MSEECVGKCEELCYCKETGLSVESVSLKAIKPGNSMGEGFFNCKGISRIRKSSMVDGKEKVTVVEVPITTARIDTTRQRYMVNKAPVPPSVQRVIYPNTPEGDELGITRPTPCRCLNLDDQNYRKDLQEFMAKLLWALAAEAVDVPMVFRGTDDKEHPAETTDDKTLALKQAGFLFAHAQVIAEDVARLCTFSEEERRSFFCES